MITAILRKTKYCQTLSLRCKYANVADYELKIEGRNYIIILHRDLGIRWSEFPLFNNTDMLEEDSTQDFLITASNFTDDRDQVVGFED